MENIRIGKMKIEKSPFTILVRNNKTQKHKSFVFGGNIETESELLELLKQLLLKHYG